MADQRGIVTPEAVLLDFPEATVGSRGVALLCDWFVQFLIGLLLALGTSPVLDNTGVPDWLPTSLYLIGAFLLLFGYPTAFETVMRGRTPGKAIMGLRVVTVEGAPITFRHAAIRAALGLVDFYATVGVVGVLSSLLAERHQRLGDFVAGTVVVRERTGARHSGPRTFEVPAAAAAIADTIDTSALTDRDYAVVRAYLVRADTLRPQQRDAVGRDVLAAIAPRLGAVPPSGLPAELLLRAVAARYQQRSSPQGAASQDIT